MTETNEEKHQTLKEQTDDALFDFFENTKHVLCSDKTRSEIVDVCLQKFREWLEQKKQANPTLIEEAYWLIDAMIKELAL